MSGIQKLRLFYLTVGLCGGILTPYLSLWMIQDGLSSSEIGVIMSIGTLVSILAQPLWGFLVDRFHRTRLTLALSALIPGLLAVFFNIHWLAALAVVNAFYNLFATPQTAIADSFAVMTAKAAGSTYGTIRLFGSLGFALGGYGGGLYLSHFELHTLWIPYVLLSLIATTAAYTFPRSPVEVAVGASFQDGFFQLLKNRRFMLFLFGGFLVSQTLTAFNTYFAVAFRQLGGSLPLTGVAFLIASGTNVPAMLIAARTISRLGPERVMMLSALVYVIRWGVQAFIPIPVVAIVIQCLHGLSFGFYYVAAVGFVAKAASRELQATAQGIFGMVCSGLAGIVGNLLNGYLLHVGGASSMYLSCTVSSLLGAACFWYVAHTKPRTRQTPIVTKGVAHL